MKSIQRIKRHNQEGFTLVELLIVIAIIGILAVLAIYGVTQYLESTKTAEAKQQIGAISRGASEAFSRSIAPSELLAAGAESTKATSGLCGTATAVPTGGPPKKAKYAPNNVPGKDFNSGDAVTGWKCLRFEITDPIYYQYNYHAGSGYLGPANGGGPDPGADGFEAAAQGDLDGDGTKSTFTLSGKIDANTKQLIRATTIFINEERE